MPVGMLLLRAYPWQHIVFNEEVPCFLAAA